eukprot:1092627-Amphidinium_carterae.2
MNFAMQARACITCSCIVMRAHRWYKTGVEAVLFVLRGPLLRMEIVECLLDDRAWPVGFT